MAPRLSAMLIGVKDEDEFYERAGQLLSSEGLGYRDVCFWKMRGDQRDLIWSEKSGEQSPSAESESLRTLPPAQGLDPRVGEISSS